MDIYFYPSDPSCDMVGEEITKQNMLEKVCSRHGIPLNNILYIGDFIVDIGAMSISKHCGCPANADENVRHYVRGRKGHVASLSWTEGCLEIFEKYAGNNLHAIVSDVDGCLYKRKKTGEDHASKVAAFIRSCRGINSDVPPLAICTGRSYSQSVEPVLNPYGFTIQNIPAGFIGEWPPLMFENGSVLYHVAEGRLENLVPELYPDYARIIAEIKKEFKQKLPKLQRHCPEEIVVPEKENMISVEIPHKIRRAPAGTEFAHRIFEIMGEICYDLDLTLCSKPKSRSQAIPE